MWYTFGLLYKLIEMYIGVAVQVIRIDEKNLKIAIFDKVVQICCHGNQNQ